MMHSPVAQAIGGGMGGGGGGGVSDKQTNRICDDAFTSGTCNGRGEGRKC